MTPLTFNLIRQSTQLSAARRGTVVMATHASPSSAQISSTDKESIEPTNGSNCSAKRVIETPGCLMYSAKGSVPHLTPDTLRLQGFGGVSVSIEQILQDHQPAGFEKNWPCTLSKFLNLQDFILLCDIRESSQYTKLPPNTDRYVSMMTHQGVRQLTLEEYFKIVRAYEPDIIATFSDSISDLDQIQPSGQLIGPGHGLKRVRKSVDRSLKWLDLILRERQGFDALAEDRALEEARKQRLKEIQQKASVSTSEDNNGHGRNQVDQVVQDTKNLQLGSASTLEAKPHLQQETPTKKPWTNVSVFAHVVGAQVEQERIRSAQEASRRQDVDGFIIDTLTLPGPKEQVFNLLKVSMDHLPATKPRLVYGMQTPEDVLKSIALGADLFDTSYPFQLTEDGKASLFSFGAPSPISDSSNIDTTTNKRWLNLWDDEHTDKFVPILKGCECYACKDGRHTRAYINHLLKAHEMLATVLLMSHNMHQYSKFFANVRQSIQDGTFEQHSASFVETFGTEPERTGEIHAAQAAVEAALSRRSRLDGDSDDETQKTAAAQAAEERKAEKESQRQARRAKNKEEGLKRKANKDTGSKTLEQELPSQQRQE
ncbi:tRNA-guanine(15) transglycosylase-like protein [Mortierella sp. GBAus27b]|nr:Queuine tRNA-ribosyltransferase subunit qtrtd1 [Mortierella sp. GBA43]KAI8353117.1 tRNA-guanine(15) transglycosylase-like protein [Mortierella sp. GBAus27b]